MNELDVAPDRFWTGVSLGRNEDCWPWKRSTQAHGYGQIAVRRRRLGRRKNFSAHRVAWALWNQKPPGAFDVMHSCDNPLCCNPAHLSLGTAQDNLADMVAKGRSLRGERHSMARLTEDDVLDIRAARAFGAELKGIASAYGITVSNVHMITARKTWRHLP